MMRLQDNAGQAVAFEQKVYWDEDVLRIQNESRRYVQEQAAVKAGQESQAAGGAEGSLKDEEGGES